MGIVEFLYDQTAFQCSNCGLRFPRNDPLEYQKHKDWHFQENVKKQNKSQYQCRRKLYPTNWITEDDPWKVDESNDDQCRDSKQEIPTVYKSSNPDENQCPECLENFDEIFKEEDIYDEIYLRNAIRPNGTNAYHPICYKDAIKQGNI